MGCGRVLDIDGVDPVGAVADTAQASRAGSPYQAGNELAIARTPNEVRPQGTRFEKAVATCKKYLLFGQRFGVRIVGQPGGRIGGLFVAAALVRSGKSHTGTTGVNQPGNPLLSTPVQNIPGSQHIDAVIGFPRAPDTCHGGRVEDAIDALASQRNRFAIAQVSTKRIYWTSLKWNERNL